jgi:hypothetical protein
MGCNESVQVNGFLQNIDFPYWTALLCSVYTGTFSTAVKRNKKGKILGGNS